MKKWLTMILALALALVAVSAAAETEEPVSDRPLPAYAYAGGDPVEAAVVAYMQGSDFAGSYYLAEGGVSVPTPVIVRQTEKDDTHRTVYGNFWVFNYLLQGDVLLCTSGGEQPGVLELEAQEDGWKVVGAEFAGDGDDYGKDLERFAGGDETLLEELFAAADGDGEALKAARRETLEAYVTANGLDVTAYQDPYWEPVALFGKVRPPMTEEEQRALIEKNRALWDFGADAEPWFYTFTDLDHNGRLEVIAASTQGSGLYTYGELWEVAADYAHLERCWQEDPELEGPQDWPDVVVEELTGYYDAETGLWFYPCLDTMRDGAARAVLTWQALCLREGKAVFMPMGTKILNSTGEEPAVACTNARGEAITEEAFDRLPETEFAGCARETLKPDWIQVGD